MNSFIEEFYYGNIDPQARSSEQNKKVQRLGIRQRRIHPRQLHHRLPLGRTIRVRYLCHIESTLHGLFERRDIKTRSGSANYGGVGFYDM